MSGECCERYCDACVWDYYERALAHWETTHAPDAPAATGEADGGEDGASDPPRP